MADLLDQRCGLGGWEWKLIDQQQVGNRLTQVWELTIIGEDGKLARASAGDEDVDVNSFGSPATNCEAQCLRRCCSKFGLGRDLWRKEKTGPKPQLPPIPVPTLKTGEISREEWLRRRQQKQNP